MPGTPAGVARAVGVRPAAPLDAATPAALAPTEALGLPTCLAFLVEGRAFPVDGAETGRKRPRDGVLDARPVLDGVVGLSRPSQGTRPLHSKIGFYQNGFHYAPQLYFQT